MGRGVAARVRGHGPKRRFQPTAGARRSSMFGRHSTTALQLTALRAAAHLFQLAILLLLPAGLVFLVTADWNRPLAVVKRLVAPGAAVVVAFTVLYYMEHLR